MVFQGALKFQFPLVIVERGHLIIFSLCVVFQPDEFIQVHFLETSEDHGILDPDDVLSDVVDDKDKVLILPTFEASFFMSTRCFLFFCTLVEHQINLKFEYPVFVKINIIEMNISLVWRDTHFAQSRIVMKNTTESFRFFVCFVSAAFPHRCIFIPPAAGGQISQSLQVLRRPGLLGVQ